MRRIPVWMVIAVTVLAFAAIGLSRGSFPQPEPPSRSGFVSAEHLVVRHIIIFG